MYFPESILSPLILICLFCNVYVNLSHLKFYFLSSFSLKPCGLVQPRASATIFSAFTVILSCMCVHMYLYFYFILLLFNVILISHLCIEISIQQRLRETLCNDRKYIVFLCAPSCLTYFLTLVYFHTQPIYSYFVFLLATSPAISQCGFLFELSTSFFY